MKMTQGVPASSDYLLLPTLLDGTFQFPIASSYLAGYIRAEGFGASAGPVAAARRGARDAVPVPVLQVQGCKLTAAAVRSNLKLGSRDEAPGRGEARSRWRAAPSVGAPRCTATPAPRDAGGLRSSY